MKYRVRLAARAIRNLRTLYRDIQAESSAQAKAWFVGLESAIFNLGEHPERCPLAPEDASSRHLLYGSKPRVYRVIFTIDFESKIVFVMQIRHGARKPDKPGRL